MILHKEHKRASRYGRWPGRGGRKLLSVVAIVLSVVGLSPGAAQANVPSGNALEFASTTAHWGYAAWTESNDYLRPIEIHPGGSFASGKCAITIFDWKTTSGHFDSRMTRTCNSGWGISTSSLDSGLGRTLVGMQKFGVCYGPKNSTNTSASYCTADSRNEGSILRTGSGSEDVSGPNTALPNNCTRSWRIEAGSSTVLYSTGGSSASCTS